MPDELNLPEEFRDYEKVAFQRKKKGVKTSIIFGGQVVRELLTALSNARDEIDIQKEIQQELIDSINARGDKIQEAMKNTNRDWTHYYNITEKHGDIYHIADNKTGLDLSDREIVDYIIGLETEIDTLKARKG